MQVLSRASVWAGCAVLLLSSGLTACPCIQDSSDVTLTPLQNGVGYTLEGAWGFGGTLSKDNPGDPDWKLAGRFVFPTGGYRVDLREIQVAESFPEQVSITVEVKPPGPFDIVTQVISEMPIQARITASDGASFKMQIVTLCPSSSGLLKTVFRKD